MTILIALANRGYDGTVEVSAMMTQKFPQSSDSHVLRNTRTTLEHMAHWQRINNFSDQEVADSLDVSVDDLHAWRSGHARVWSCTALKFFLVAGGTDVMLLKQPTVSQADLVTYAHALAPAKAEEIATLLHVTHDSFMDYLKGTSQPKPHFAFALRDMMAGGGHVVRAWRARVAWAISRRSLQRSVVARLLDVNQDSLTRWQGSKDPSVSIMARVLNNLPRLDAVWDMPEPTTIPPGGVVVWSNKPGVYVANMTPELLERTQIRFATDLAGWQRKLRQWRVDEIAARLGADTSPEMGAGVLARVDGILYNVDGNHRMHGHIAAKKNMLMVIIDMSLDEARQLFVLINHPQKKATTEECVAASDNPVARTYKDFDQRYGANAGVIQMLVGGLLEGGPKITEAADFYNTNHELPPWIAHYAEEILKVWSAHPYWAQRSARLRKGNQKAGHFFGRPAVMRAVGKLMRHFSEENLPHVLRVLSKADLWKNKKVSTVPGARELYDELCRELLRKKIRFDYTEREVKALRYPERFQKGRKPQPTVPTVPTVPVIESRAVAPAKAAKSKSKSKSKSSRKSPEPNAREKARELIRSALSDGPVERAEMIARAEASNIARNTLERAAADLSVVKGARRADATILWSLPQVAKNGSATRSAGGVKTRSG